MSETINFGIDLGTTNSSIAKYVKGDVIAFSNPTDYGRNTLPSVVAFKKNSIFVGSQAKSYLEKDPKNVVGGFKRKMGTTESFKIKSLNRAVTPIELSALVIKELKSFLPPGDAPRSAVVTIPASFDMVQSNATKEAGTASGFDEVVLLQEPIAASLAYANMKKETAMTDGQWLVYDLGGGTFDAALIKIHEGEMRVLDHEGDNYLGGTDFDDAIVEGFVVPALMQEYSFNDILHDLKSNSGRLNGKYYVLLHGAEELKIQLSARQSASLEIDNIIDDEGVEVSLELQMSRTEFESLIKEHIDRSIEKVKSIVVRNTLQPQDVQFVLMIGGSTYIPYVRQRVEEMLQIPINCSIDPTTAVAVGAAYYASTKTSTNVEASGGNTNQRISIKTSYEKISREKEELFAAKVSGDLEGLVYRVTRSDGGYDSGVKPLTERIQEDLPLLEDSFNCFTFAVSDRDGNAVATNLESIEINSGYGISGQPLPEDICIEVDDANADGRTKLECIFRKGTVLPAKKTVTKTANRRVVRGSEKDAILINVYEGPEESLPEANKRIGLIAITGRNVQRDIAKGSDIELNIAMTESRDLTVNAYLNMADQEFQDTFNPKQRDVHVPKLLDDVTSLMLKLEQELDEAKIAENYEAAEELSSLRREVRHIADGVASMPEDDVSDQKYQIDDKKRIIARKIYDATRDKRLLEARARYYQQKERCESILETHGNDQEHKHYNDIIQMEPAFISSNSVMRIDEQTDRIDDIIGVILWRTPEFLVAVFKDLVSKSVAMNEQSEVRLLIQAGKSAIDNEQWEKLAEINTSMINKMPRSSKKDYTTIIGFY